MQGGPSSIPEPEEVDFHILFTWSDDPCKFGGQEYEEIYPNMATQEKPLAVKNECLDIVGKFKQGNNRGFQCQWSLRTKDQQGKYVNPLYWGGEARYYDEECSTGGFLKFSDDFEIGNTYQLQINYKPEDKNYSDTFKWYFEVID